MSKMNIRRGDVFLVDFGPQWSGEHGKRPAVVVQNNIGNEHSKTVIVVPCATKIKRMDMPTHVFLGPLENGRADSMVVCENVQTIEKDRIVHYISKLSKRQMDRVDDALKASLGLTKRWRDV